jgi:hypothetical protein
LNKLKHFIFDTVKKNSWQREKLKEKWQFVINNMVAIKEDKKINRNHMHLRVSLCFFYFLFGEGSIRVDTIIM